MIQPHMKNRANTTCDIKNKVEITFYKYRGDVRMGVLFLAWSWIVDIWNIKFRIFF